MVMEIGFCVLEGLISMVEKGVLWSASIKKQYYWHKGVPAEEILRHMQNKEVGDLDAVQGPIRGKSYHIMAIKEPDYVMLMMTTYGKLEHLEGLDTQQRYKGGGGKLVTKQFNCCEVFRNHFNYRHQVYDNNNRHHSPIPVEINWATRYWPDRFHAYFLALVEVNANYLRGYLVDVVDVEPQLDFQCQLG